LVTADLGNLIQIEIIIILWLLNACAVLSDSNKRFLYDVGAYDSDDEDHDVCLKSPEDALTTIDF
jgi:hypothetical protein